jgi:magnesium transporter
VVLHTVELAGDELKVGEVDIFVGPNYILSVRSRTERGFADVRARSEREPKLLRHGSAYVLYAIMDAVVDRYFPVLDALEAELEEVEKRIFSGQSNRAIIESLYVLKQKLMTLKRATAPLQEASSKLYGGRVPQLCAGLQEYFRDVYDHLARVNQSIESLREMVTTAISVNLSLLTIQENEVTKRLAAYAALVAVPTMIAGVYGMNFDNMPELTWRLGYPVTVAVMVAIDGYLFYRFRKAKWL